MVNVTQRAILTNVKRGFNIMTKFIYYRVIQTNSGYGWDADDFHEAKSDYTLKDRKPFNENLKAYRANFSGSIRVVNRRELRAS